MPNGTDLKYTIRCNRVVHEHIVHSSINSSDKYALDRLWQLIAWFEEILTECNIEMGAYYSEQEKFVVANCIK